MAITVAMIEEKEFKTKMRGYDPVEVDEFLDDICDEMVSMQEEIATLNQRLAQAGKGGAPFTPVPAPIPAPLAVEKPAAKEIEKAEENVSESAQKLLARAQKMYDETIADAKAEAEKILSEARNKADSTVIDLVDEKEALQNEVEMLRAAAKDYRERFLRLVEDQQHVLNSEKELFE